MKRVQHEERLKCEKKHHDDSEIWSNMEKSTTWN